MALSADFAQTLKLQADIVLIVGDYISLKKAGAQNFSGLCPFHKEKTPSFSVHATRQFYHCFGCGASGDVFSFVQKIENITFPEAVRLVAQKLGVALPKTIFSSEAEARDAKLRTTLLEVHERACAFFQECLHRSEGARALANGGGLPCLERLNLGWNDIGPQGAAALAGSPHLGALRSLDLNWNAIGSEGLTALARSGAFPNLRTLDVS